MARAKKHKQRPRRRWKTSQILTWAGLGLLAIAIVVVGFAAFTGGDADAKPRRSLRQDPVVSDERQVTIDVVDNDYEPRDLTVREGAEVTWRFEGDLPHTVTDEEGLFDSDVLEEGDEYVLTFEDAGTYHYYCTLHHAMQGTLTVEP